MRAAARLLVLSLPWALSCGSSSTDTSANDASSPDALGSADSAVGDAVALDAAIDPCGVLDHTWRRCAANPLARAGAQQPDGRYELSIGDPDVQFDAEANRWRAWWSTGLALTYSDPTPTLAIKYAESADGLAWNVQRAPVISGHRSTDDWDYSKLETPSVVKVPSNPPDRRWVMYYSGGNDGVKMGPGYTWYQLGVAFSADGTSFARLPAAESPYAGASAPYANVEGLVLLGKDAFPGLAGVADGLVADPEVVLVDGTFHLFFSSLAVDAAGNPLAYGISHATSPDGVHFTMAEGNPIAALAGSSGPSIARRDDGVFELYFARDSDADKAAVPSTFNPMVGAWRVTSTDLSAWTPPASAREVAWDGAFTYEKYGWIATGDAVIHGAERRWYYVAFDADGAPSGWVVPTHDGFQPAVIALSMMRQVE